MSGALPALDALPELRAALSTHRLVLLQAPPGAGKSTALPLELLHEPWLGTQSVLLLQPRRVAARAVATRLAQGLGEPVGETVGYRVRFESRVGPRTRLSVLTEGLLTRQLQGDPELAGVGLVIFDEFHERSLHADLAFALVREVQAALRDDLRVLVMSATLDPALRAELEALSGEPVPLVFSEGRQYPVTVHQAPRDLTGDPAAAVAGAVTAALAAHGGDVLAFLPGTGEIRRTAALLEARHPELSVLPLHGELPPQEQDRALAPDPAGRRKVVLATTVAETSLTIPGVRVVVDSGLTRRSTFDPATGLSRLTTGRVSQDAATQRAGRAGRTAPGVAYRLWTPGTQALLAPARTPEVLDADLAPLSLEAAAWGSEPAGLPWLTPPPPRALTHARTLLERLEALDRAGRLTPTGRELLALPTHPRLAHLLLGGARRGLGALAADVAALLEERDPFSGGSGPRDSGSDLTRRVEALRRWRAGQPTPGDRHALARAERLSAVWRQRLGVPAGQGQPDPRQVGELIWRAYPERAARNRGRNGRLQLAGGQGAVLPEGDEVASEPWLAVAHLDGSGADARVWLAAPLDPALLDEAASAAEEAGWDRAAGLPTFARVRRYHALELSREPLRDVPPARLAAALTDAVRQEGLEVLPWTDAARQLQARVLCLREWYPDECDPDDGWPDLSDAALLATLPDWLTPALDGLRRLSELSRLRLSDLLRAQLPWTLARRLDELAPPTLPVPSGHQIPVEYRPGEPPILAVKLQELFGLADTPTVNGGRTPVLLHLLSPARRPVQVTQDLRSFWNSSYFEVRRELKGRYPKHPWPDDPWTAEATRKAKPRGT